MNSASGSKVLKHVIILSDSSQVIYYDTPDVMSNVDRIYKFAGEYNNVCDDMSKNDRNLEGSVTGTRNTILEKAQTITGNARKIMKNTKVDGYNIDDERLGNHIFNKSQTINYVNYNEAYSKVVTRLNRAQAGNSATGNSGTGNNSLEVSRCRSDLAKLEQLKKTIDGWGAYIPKTRGSTGNGSSSGNGASRSAGSSSIGNSSSRSVGSSSIGNNASRSAGSSSIGNNASRSAGSSSIGSGNTSYTGNSSAGNGARR